MTDNLWQCEVPVEMLSENKHKTNKDDNLWQCEVPVEMLSENKHKLN